MIGSTTAAIRLIGDRYWAYVQTSQLSAMLSDLRLSLTSAHLDASVMCVDYLVLPPGPAVLFRRRELMIHGEQVMRILLQAYLHATQGVDVAPTLDDIRFIHESFTQVANPRPSSSEAGPGQLAAWSRACSRCLVCQELRCACGLHLSRIIEDGLVLQRLGEATSESSLTFIHRCSRGSQPLRCCCSVPPP